MFLDFLNTGNKTSQYSLIKYDTEKIKSYRCRLGKIMKNLDRVEKVIVRLIYFFVCFYKDKILLKEIVILNTI